MDDPSPPQDTPSPPIEETSKRPPPKGGSKDEPLFKRRRQIFPSSLLGTSANVEMPFFDDTQTAAEISGYSASDNKINEIVESLKVPSKENMFTISKVLNNIKGEQYTRRFKGKYLEAHAWILYLQEKLEDETICFAYSPDAHGGYMLKFEANTRVEPRPKFKFLFVKRDFYTKFFKCKKEHPNLRFIIVILQLPGHLNGLIFDFQEQDEYEGVITRFEPHGAKAKFDHKAVDEILKNYFLKGEGEIEQLGENKSTDQRLPKERRYFQNWAYRSPIEFCPRDGPQNIESRIRKKGEKGYCAAWTLLIMHYRIENPQMTDKQVIEYFTEKTKEELKQMIETYSAWEVYVLDEFEDLPLIYEKGDWVAIFESAVFKGYGKIIGLDPRSYYVHTAAPLYFSSQKALFEDWYLSYKPNELVKITNEETIAAFEKSVDIQEDDFVEYWDREEKDAPLVLVGAGRVLESTAKELYSNVTVFFKRVYQNNYGISEAEHVIPKYKLKKRIFKGGDYVYLHSSVQQITGHRYRILDAVRITGVDKEDYCIRYINEDRWVSALDLSTK